MLDQPPALCCGVVTENNLNQWLYEVTRWR